MSTISKDDYIKTIYELSILNGSVKPSQIAQSLKVSKSAITDMIKKLVRDEFVIRESTGLFLTKSGEKIALNLIRKHRIWETFLSKTLKLDWSEIHEEAENLEHATSNFLINKIDEFLSFPKTDPHGSPIPDINYQIDQTKIGEILLSKTEGSFVITAINDKDKSIIKLMNLLNIQLGTHLKIISKIESDNSLFVSIDGKEQILSLSIITKLYVKAVDVCS